MNVDSDDWQAMGTTVYRLYNDKRGYRCNEFIIQISGDTEVSMSEKEKLAASIVTMLNRPVTPL